MNKYERALELISKEVSDDHFDDEFQMLDELVNKATPTKVHNSSLIADSVNVWLCPKCGGYVTNEDNYCSSCGQNIEWR